MPDKDSSSVIVTDPNILGGAYPVFRGTRVPYLQLKGTEDGKLLTKIADVFNVLITMDGNIRYQQNFSKHPQFSTISLSAENNSLTKILHLVSVIRNALRKIKPGQHIRIP